MENDPRWPPARMEFSINICFLNPSPAKKLLFSMNNILVDIFDIDNGHLNIFFHFRVEVPMMTAKLELQMGYSRWFFIKLKRYKLFIAELLPSKNNLNWNSSLKKIFL